ncbi:hypothetical protein EDB81DRAFT_824290 [Dactylonectria macrodidyma]|uniref:Uncharacterized protein n=1 Tax=Dactylonectria macrodidyma TaxID=307937 RepID=A0A9P9D7H0_9HYPO|nr:hypothetical protein EDB81DRAFT_824290 [Dactylonectria macrodidyma]
MKRHYNSPSPVSGSRHRKRAKDVQPQDPVTKVVEEMTRALEDLGQDQLITKLLRFDIGKGSISLYQVVTDDWLQLKTSKEMWESADKLEAEQKNRDSRAKAKDGRMAPVWVLRYTSSSIDIYEGLAPQHTRKRRWQTLTRMVNLIMGKVGPLGLRVIDALASKNITFPTIVDLKEETWQAIAITAGQMLHNLLQGGTLMDIQNTSDDIDVLSPLGLINYFSSKKPKDNLKKLSLESFPVTHSDIPLVKLAEIKLAYQRKTEEAMEELGLRELLHTEAFPITSPLLENQPYKIIDLPDELQKIALRAGACLANHSDSVEGLYDWEENGLKHRTKFRFLNYPLPDLIGEVFNGLISHLRHLNILGREEESYCSCRVIRHEYGPIATPKGRLQFIIPLKKVWCTVRLGNHGLETKSEQWTIRSAVLLQKGWIESNVSILYLSTLISISSPSI